MDQNTLNILIIEDDRVDRMELLRAIKKTGLRCNTVEKINLQEGMAACYQMNFDCAIIDYQLPGQDGLKGISFFNANFPYMAIIMSTAHGNEMVATEALKNGASDYIVKKYLNPSLLKKSIINAIETMRLKKQLQEKEAKIEYLAHHDYLTDIPNRLSFNLVLTRLIKQAERHKKQFAVLFLDLDHFKNINDSFGHSAGDLLLQQVSNRFKLLMRGEDVIARLGGDEFGVLISDLNRVEDAEKCAVRLIDALRSPFIIQNEKINITLSIGIATFPMSGETVSELMHNADQAMYQAKSTGKNRFKFYTPE